MNISRQTHLIVLTAATVLGGLGCAGEESAPTEVVAASDTSDGAGQPDHSAQSLDADEEGPDVVELSDILPDSAGSLDTADPADLVDPTEVLPDSKLPCAPLCEARECGDDGCGGSCGGCDDDNPCTDDSCVGIACVFDANTAACDDGNPCTSDDVCVAGACAGELLPPEDLVGLGCVCLDDDDCLSVDDNDICNGTLWCVIEDAGPGLCQVEPGTTPDCDDGLACTVDGCDAVSGCLFAPDNALCDDENECTDDICDGVGGCLHPAAVDGSACQAGSGTCQAGDCMCAPACGGKECGDDGCGGDCGPCPGGQDACIDSICVCQPDCEGKGCGWDGCSALCIECPEGKSCKAATMICECTYEACGDVCCGDYQLFCHEGECVYFVEQPPVVLTFQNVTGTTAELWMENQVAIAGFQFTSSGLTITSAGAGSAEGADFMVSIGDAANFVIGFSLASSTIPPGKAMLLELKFAPKGFPNSFCLGALIFTDAQSQIVDVIVIPECYQYLQP